VWDNGDLAAGIQRYFVVVRVVDGSGRPSSKQIMYIDAKKKREPENRIADADSYIDSLFPAVNYSTSDYVRVVRVGTTRMHTMLYWDLTDISAGTEIEEATIYLWCREKTVGADIGAFKILVEWINGEVTYNVRETGVAWGTPGGEEGTDFCDTAEDWVSVGSKDAWYGWDVTDAIQEMIDDPGAVRGFFVRNPGYNVQVEFDSIETATSAHKPYLHLVFA